MKIKTILKKQYRKFIFNLSKNDSFLYRIIYSYFYFPKKNSLDAFINQFSLDNKGLTVVQIGANDGIFHDPIHKFIRRDHWKGVLLEPQKQVFNEYLQVLHSNTPNIHCINAALDHQNGERHLYKLSFSEARWATGLASFDRARLEESIASGHVARRAKKEGIPLPKDKEDYIISEKIESISAASLLEKYKIKTIDFLQIDTEGYDFEIIKMFLNINSPRIIVYEQYHLSKEDLIAAKTFLNEKGYITKVFGGNTLAILKSEEKYLQLFLI